MKRIDNRSVELTDDELIVDDEHDELMGMGFNQVEAVELITGKGEAAERNWQSAHNLKVKTVREELLEKLPHLDSILTPEFVAWLSE